MRPAQRLGALFVVLVAIVAPIVGCHDDAAPSLSPTPPPIAINKASVDGLIGPEGGVLVHPSGARLVIPVGALAAPTRLTLAGIDPPAALTDGSAVLGQGYAAGPDGQWFLKPVELFLPFDATRIAAGTDASNAQVQMASHGSSAFSALQTEVDLIHGLLHASTAHFTDFVPAVNPNPVFITAPPVLADGTTGEPYVQFFSAAGGTAPYAFSLSAGSALPSGLTIAPDGKLSGTPTVPTAFAFFVTAQDSAARAVQKAFALSVLPAINPVPVLSLVSPSAVAQGSTSTPITVSGTGFVPTSQVLFDGTPLPAAFIATTQLNATLDAALLVTAGTHQISVVSPTPGGGTSAPFAFTVTAGTPNPVPAVVSVSPTALPVGAPDTQIGITGTNFIAASSAAIGAQGISTRYVSPTQLDATIPASFLAAPGTLQIGVFNPAPGGGFSASTAAITVGTLNPVPSLASLSPSSVVAGSSDFTLAVTGSSFVTGGQIFFGSTALATTVSNATSASATVPSSAVPNVGTAQVVFVNPAPGGGASAALTFTIVAPGADAGGADAADSGGPPGITCTGHTGLPTDPMKTEHFPTVSMGGGNTLTLPSILIENYTLSPVTFSATFTGTPPTALIGTAGGMGVVGAAVDSYGLLLPSNPPTVVTYSYFGRRSYAGGPQEVLVSCSGSAIITDTLGYDTVGPQIPPTPGPGITCWGVKNAPPGSPFVVEFGVTATVTGPSGGQYYLNLGSALFAGVQTIAVMRGNTPASFDDPATSFTSIGSATTSGVQTDASGNVIPHTGTVTVNVNGSERQKLPNENTVTCAGTASLQ